MLRKTWILIFVVSLFLFSIVETGLTARVYDNFNGTGIDLNKWQEGTIVRKIDGGKLLFITATPSPAVMTSFPYRYPNNVGFSNPSSISSIQAEVKILESNITGTARTYAILGGRFYNNGAAGGGYAGDIWAEVSIYQTSTGGLRAYYYIGQYLTSSDTITDVPGGAALFDTPIATGTTYVLYIKYDSTANQFTFKVKSLGSPTFETKTFGPPGLPAPDTPPDAHKPWKGLHTQARTYDATQSASISVTFDNVYTNETLYDEFGSPTIDTSKWANSYEYRREVTSGHLYSLANGSAADQGVPVTFPYMLSPGLSLNWNNPVLDSLKFGKAIITPISFSQSNGALVGARMSVNLYNDGSSSPPSWVGDIYAYVGLYADGTTLGGLWGVGRHNSDPPNLCQLEILEQGTFTTDITLGSPYNFFVGFDGSTITFKLDNEVATYTTTPPYNPPHNSWGNIGSRVILCDATQAGIMEAQIDDVIINDPSSVDTDFDGKTDIAVYRTNTGAWYVYPSGGGSPYGFGWGGDASDNPAPGDYDGDGKTDIAVYRTSTGAWYVYPSGGGSPYGFGWGGDTTDKPAPGDYDGDGKTDIAVYRTSTGAWYVYPSGGGSPYGFGWGGDTTDKPTPGDYDGDGKTDIAVYRTSTGAWYIYPSGGGSPYGFGWGGDGTDKPAPGDYDGDGKTDIAVYRTSTGAWYVYPSGGGSPYGFGWGGDGGDKPAPGDYDGDGKTDIAVYRTGTGAWYIYPSGGGPPYGIGWGGDASDLPVVTNPVAFM